MQVVPNAAEPRDTVSLTHDVFVSHSVKDKVVADAIVAHLEAAGLRCWVAPRDVLPGRIWSEEIVRAIQSSRVMVLILSGNANSSRQVLREVDHAATNGLVIMPFRTEPIELAPGLSYYLASEHWLDAITPPLEAHIDRLVTAVRQVLGSGRGDGSAPQDEGTASTSPAVAVSEPLHSRAAEPGSARSGRLVASIVAAAAVIVGLAVVLVFALGQDGATKRADTTGSNSNSVSNSSSATQTQPSATPTATDDLTNAVLSCKLVDPADMKAVIGYDPGPGTPDGSTGFCTYGVDFPDVWIEQQGATKTDFDVLRQDAAAGTTDVPGVGGGAYLEHEYGTSTVVVLDTKRAIIFELVSAGSDTRAGQQLVDIAKRTVARG